MSTACNCGMALDQPFKRVGCHECGTACCRSCVIEVEANTYCRWCAMSLAAQP
ncbi:MAG: hypothetical protein HY215_07800 [Candidatus Rokubacteria bacterium]|nr:hypothetical protein [Candidatus Rokubacteria bacterium]MBI3626033.1 hypothetical protein [Candidatus Rokubacteria bacterium]